MVLNARRLRIQSASSSEDDDETTEDIDLLEPWSEFLRRTAGWTEQQLKASGQSEWLAVWRKRQWTWAGKVATKDRDKWSGVATQWLPLLHSSELRGRAQARPRKRWEQDLVEFLAQEAPTCHDSWHLQAQDTLNWSRLADKFVQHTCCNL